MWDTRRLRKRIDDHKQKSSSVYKHLKNKHNIAIPTCLLEQFNVFAKCHTKFDCLITEMLFIRIFKITIPQRANWLCSCLSVCVTKFLCQYANYGILIDTSGPSTNPCYFFSSRLVQGHCFGLGFWKDFEKMQCANMANPFSTSKKRNKLNVFAPFC